MNASRGLLSLMFRELSSESARLLLPDINGSVFLLLKIFTCLLLSLHVDHGKNLGNGFADHLNDELETKISVLL